MHDNTPFIIQGEENYRKFLESCKEHNATQALERFNSRRNQSMDEHEAIKILKRDLAIQIENKALTDGIDAIKTAIKALEKQIPKKPIYSEFDDNGNDEIVPYKASCPICRYEFEFGTWNDEENHHCICGQSINWHR